MIDRIKIYCIHSFFKEKIQHSRFSFFLFNPLPILVTNFSPSPLTEQKFLPGQQGGQHPVIHGTSIKSTKRDKIRIIHRGRRNEPYSSDHLTPARRLTRKICPHCEIIQSGDGASDPWKRCCELLLVPCSRPCTVDKTMFPCRGWIRIV